MKKFSLTVMTAVLLTAMVTACSGTTQTADYNVIPKPQEISLTSDGGDFKLSGSTVIVNGVPGNDTIARYAGFLSDYIEQLTGHRLDVVDQARDKNAIILTTGLSSDNREAYDLKVTPGLITIQGATQAGVFYGMQTLRKSIPGQVKGDVLFPAVNIADYPRFGYRGAMLDVARHFFPADSVKSFIDMMALHNMNTLHWHLTDDQGWRIEIKALPGLTEIGSKRAGTVIGHNSGKYDGIPYGGFYTQDEIRDIVKYAADRNINIMPEIDLPGHMVAALTAYPELGCTGGPYDVWQIWGVSEDLLCAGNDSTYAFLRKVFDEVTDLFPSELIHIGGDECPKVRWAECAKCQAKIRQLGLKSDIHSSKENKLQAYVMEQMAEYLATKGRRVIGWDEILEGGVSQDAAIMSWRGVNGGLQGARAGHDVVMTPNNYLYFDYYQSLDHSTEPEAIGGYVPVEKVYSFDPVLPEFTPEEAAHIKGVQANLWTEYIPNYWQVEYMELPRMAALSEVQWSEPEKKDYEDFCHRIPQLINHYEANGYTYARHIFNVKADLTPDYEKGAVVVEMSTVDGAPIHYTLDGTEPGEQSPLYTEPVSLTESSVVKAAAFRPSGMSPVWCDSVVFSKSTARDIKLLTTPHPRFAAKGAQTLNDGRYGESTYSSDTWIGFNGEDLVAEIDLGESQEISSVSFNAFVLTGDWIFDATDAKIEVSEDGKDYTTAATAAYPVPTEHADEIATHEITFDPVKCRYVKVTLGSVRRIPDFHPGKGKPGFLFVDEIVID